MNNAQLQHIKQRFHSYVNVYMLRAGDKFHLLELKRIHSAFVAVNCKKIAELEGWNDSDRYMAEAIGLLHDIGRFIQLEKYRTFDDSISVDHGECGYQILNEEQILEDLTDKERNTILFAVCYHNKLKLEKSDSHLKNRFLKLIRDADKLDIYRVIQTALKENHLEEHPEIVLNLPLDTPPSSKLLDRIEKGLHPTYAELTSAYDFIILILSWSNQMNFKATLQLMGERKILASFCTYLPMDISQVSRVVEIIKSTINKVCCLEHCAKLT